jgi:hypothetical protein
MDGTAAASGVRLCTADAAVAGASAPFRRRAKILFGKAAKRLSSTVASPVHHPSTKKSQNKIAGAIL